MITRLFNNISSKEKNNAVESLFTHSTPSNDFFLMIILSICMATLGLFMNSSAIVVGSMLIAPLLYPILSLAMGIIMSDFGIMAKSFITLLKAIIISIVVAALITLLFASQIEGYSEEILSRTEPSVFSVAIGALAGFAAAFALVKPKISETLPGIAISVALIPPLAVVGIGLARLDMTVLLGALLLFLINAVGVIFTAVIVFSLMNFYVKRNIAIEVVKEEEQKLKKEEQKKD